jgi:hypothetical protein
MHIYNAPWRQAKTWILCGECIYLFPVIPRKIVIIFLNSLSALVFARDKQCVSIRWCWNVSINYMNLTFIRFSSEITVNYNTRYVIYAINSYCWHCEYVVISDEWTMNAELSWRWPPRPLFIHGSSYNSTLCSLRYRQLCIMNLKKRRSLLS